MTNSFNKKQIGLAVACALATAAAVTFGGCSPQPSAVAPVISDKVYTVTPDSVKAKVGIVSGELTEMKVTERIEEGSGRVASPAKLTGKLALKNISADQTVRLIGGKILYIDAQGKTITLEDNRTAPILKVASGYNSSSSERLHPRQATSQS